MGFDKLRHNKYRNILFTTPSHSQKFCILNKFRHFYKYDVSETDTHSPEIMLEEAEKYASAMYGVRKTKFLTNGSTSGIIISVMSAVQKGDNVLLSSNAHQCHLNAAKLAGANPIFYDLPLNDFGVQSAVDAGMLEQYFQNNSVKALIVTSPTYEGYVSDIKSLKELCQKYGAYLIVDEAHGALYPFSDELPQSAVQYADFTVQSLHKTAGGLNPTALLHINCNCEIVDIISTTSPSYPLLMSIERNIRYLTSSQGKKELNKLIENLKSFRRDISGYTLGGDDITKILIKKDGLTGYELSEKLFNLGIEDERTNDISTLLITGIGTKKDKLETLKLALKRI